MCYRQRARVNDRCKAFAGSDMSDIRSSKNSRKQRQQQGERKSLLFMLNADVQPPGITWWITGTCSFAQNHLGKGCVQGNPPDWAENSFPVAQSCPYFAWKGKLVREQRSNLQCQQVLTVA